MEQHPPLSKFESQLFPEDLIPLASKIATELENRNLQAMTYVPRIIYGDDASELKTHCQEVYRVIKENIGKQDIRELIDRQQIEGHWINMAKFLAEDRSGRIDIEKLAIYISIAFIDKYHRPMDDQIENIDGTSLLISLSINPDKDKLVDVSGANYEIRSQAIVFDKVSLIYPHQFMRRYYSGYFADLLPLLGKAKAEGLKVKIRIDQNRITDASNYLEIVEADFWSGPPFKRELLTDPYKSDRTIHGSVGITMLGDFHVDRTVIRTKMMDSDQREFSIEEYCPLSSPQSNYTKPTPGVGKRLCIQRFGHFVYDQAKSCVTHVDGAVRVFTNEEYEDYYKTIKSGKDIDEKVGQRHKIFWVGGNIELATMQELITSWFRYNPHVIEYFTGTRIEPILSFEELSEIFN